MWYLMAFPLQQWFFNLEWLLLLLLCFIFYLIQSCAQLNWMFMYWRFVWIEFTEGIRWLLCRRNVELRYSIRAERFLTSEQALKLSEEAEEWRYRSDQIAYCVFVWCWRGKPVGRAGERALRSHNTAFVVRFKNIRSDWSYGKYCQESKCFLKQV
jgi:hypothetical protein